MFNFADIDPENLFLERFMYAQLEEISGNNLNKSSTGKLVDSQDKCGTVR